MLVHCFALFASLALQSVTVQASDGLTTIVAAEGDRIELTCPVEVQHWTLRRQHLNTIINRGNSLGSHHTVVAAHDDSVGCQQELQVSSDAGSPLIIEKISTNCAGLFTCVYNPPQSPASSRSWTVTVISRNSLQLYIQPDGESIFRDSTDRIHFPVESELALSCLLVHSGFVNPQMQLVVKRNGSEERVLASTHERTMETYVSDETANLSATYVVQQNDTDIEVGCSIFENGASKLTTSQRIRRSAIANNYFLENRSPEGGHRNTEKRPEEFTRRGKGNQTSEPDPELVKTQHELVAIVVGGVIAFLLVVIAIIVIVIVFRRKIKRQQQRLHQMEATGIHLQLNYIERNQRDATSPNESEYKDDTASSPGVHFKHLSTASTYLLPASTDAGNTRPAEEKPRQSLLAYGAEPGGHRSNRLCSDESATSQNSDSQNIYEKVN